MKIRNYTDIPTETIKTIIAFVRPNGISGFDVRVSNSKHRFYGRAYTQGCAYHDNANPFIVIRVTPDESKYPFTPNYQNTRYKNSGYIPCELKSRLEAVIHLIAHELRHIWQAKYPHSKRLGKGRGKFSEIDADTYANKKLEEWRVAQ